MNVFETHAKIVSDYASYIRSFINISDPAIRKVVDESLNQGRLWPEPLLHFNPAYKIVGSVEEIAKKGILHGATPDIFSGYKLYQHQVEAIQLGTSGKDFVVTSGTGSGKSLTYIGTIFNHLLTAPPTPGVTAVVVYPMNALINSQTNEFKTYQENYERATGKTFPITFGQYTGQEKDEARQRMRQAPPQILLTNYMMLELLLTRIQERQIRDAIYDNLRFLVFDELHTYRGRQGADVAMLIRRIRAKCKQSVTCIGTSATMVSVGSTEEQRKQVADVATSMFGREFKPEQVVNETLARSLDYNGALPDQQSIATAIDWGVDPLRTEAELRSNPLAIWLENAVALEERDGQLLRRKPLQVGKVVDALSDASGRPKEVCRRILTDVLLWISTVNQQLRGAKSKYTLLPYKLHQFFAQTGSVYSTLDQDGTRFITLEPGIYKKDEKDKKPIYPIVFSRASGYPFICVSRIDSRIEPREFRDKAPEDVEATEGYLVIGDDVWDPESDYENLPESWFNRSRSGIKPKADYLRKLPRKLWFDEYGNCSENEPMKHWGWFMPAPLLFDPTGGVFFDTKTHDATKLTKLGSEGRSTSTTITTFSVLNRLRDANYHPRDQKLLSFTDNRQDAALQAGHFNDFVQTVQLRAAIHKALVTASPVPHTFATIGEAIFNALDLPFLEFANRGDVPQLGGIRKKYEQAFKDYLFYRAVADLRRSWRIVLPNLEQCALLRVGYEDLKEASEEDAFWANLEIAKDLSPVERYEFLSNVLDFFRLEYAIHSENYLSPAKLKENEKLFREQLKAPWTLDRDEDLREPCVIRLDPLHRAAHLASKSMGAASSLGKYLKQFAKQKDLDLTFLRGENYRGYVLALMRKLTDADYLFETTARSESNQEVPVYRLRIDKIRWHLGDGETVKPDVIKRRSYKDYRPGPNVFFREMYRRDFSTGKKLHAEDHTGQLSTEDRQDREDRFRAEWYVDAEKKLPDDEKIRTLSLAALFCSPTMELGIDIGGLSVVHMRNAPPNAANYAQRSGRAGRSGQGALIFTYCSSYSPHDRHYFDHQEELVAGTVQTPRLDLCNQELLLTHLNAVAVSEVGVPGLEPHEGERPSLMRLVVDDVAMALAPGVREGLKLSASTHEAVKETFRRVLSDFSSTLKQKSPWYTDEWVESKLHDLANQLDRSLGRWRELYHSARTLLTRATQPIESGRLTIGSDEYRKYKRQQDQANRQLNLLRNDIGGANEISEFYPYRYLASEGFLPGYNFTRLPLRVFLSSGTSGDFISRPRPIALQEFGPLNIIYHNGRKYRICELVVHDADAALTNAKISTKAGYFLTGEQKDLEFCPFSGANLGDNANVDHLHDLLEMSESRAEETERISCEEEERTRKGFAIETYFAVDGEFDRVKKAVIRTSEAAMLNLRYIPAARLVHVNRQWRAQHAEGFPMGMTSGNWRSSMPDAKEKTRETYRLVKLFTTNVADALYIEPIQPLGLDANGVITLQHALKRAIESVFQVEPSEIGVVSMGDKKAPNILLYEAAEGSLGILSQFVEFARGGHPFHAVIDEAIKICRFDDPTYLAPASYDDLLSYYNQTSHRVIDRFLIKDALEKLSMCSVEIQTSTAFRDYEEQYQWMMRNLDPNSSTERALIDYLYQHDLRLPDAAQKSVDGIYCRPDFYYDPRFWVFCDGSPHDRDDVRERDAEQRQLIISRGDEVWSWHYREDLATKVAQRPDIFRKVR